MNEYVLTDLPTSYDLSSRSLRQWLPGRQFDSSDYVVLDDHPYACDTTHRARSINRPGSGSEWQSYWTRALWPSTRYRIGSALLGFQEFVTDDATPPIARGIVTSQIRSIPGTTYTLLQADHGKILDFTSGSAVTVTVPSGLAADFVVGISQGGAGQVTLEDGDEEADVTILEPDDQLSTAARYVLLTLMAFSQDSYRLYGRTA